MTGNGRHLSHGWSYPSSLRAMLYYYTDSQNQTCGPVELRALHAALHEGTLTPETLVVEAGGTEWKPLAAVLRYYYSTGGGGSRAGAAGGFAGAVCGGRGRFDGDAGGRE